MGLCSICLETRSRPCCCVPCGHLFCRDCIEAWFTHTRICPDCRKEIDRLQSVFGLEEEIQNIGTSDEAAGPRPTALPLISELQQRIPQQRPYFIALTVIFTLFLLIDLITSGGGWTSYVFHSAAAISSAMFNILWDLSAMVVNVLIALIKFPFHFVANLPSYCDSVSNFFHHLFWFVIYAVIVILVIWYCVHTVLITIERREWKLKRKMKKKQ